MELLLQAGGVTMRIPLLLSNARMETRNCSVSMHLSDILPFMV